LWSGSEGTEANGAFPPVVAGTDGAGLADAMACGTAASGSDAHGTEGAVVAEPHDARASERAEEIRGVFMA
jgi:hypothetical protein